MYLFYTYSNPLISDNIINCESFLWISLQHAFNEIFCVFGNLKKSKQLFLIIIACPKKKIREIELLYSISRNFYLSPFRIGKFISSWPNSLFHSRRNGQTVVTVKWRETTQPEKINIWIWILKFCAGNLKYDLQNVHNDSQWPNITRFVVSFWT